MTSLSSEITATSVPGRQTLNTGAAFHGTDRVFIIRTGTYSIRHIRPSAFLLQAGSMAWKDMTGRITAHLSVPIRIQVLLSVPPKPLWILGLAKFGTDRKII
jgi:hypothetical protein